MSQATTTRTHRARWPAMVLLVLPAFSSHAEDLDKYRYQPDKKVSQQNPLQGQKRKDFECLDKNQDGQIDKDELKHRKSCLDKRRIDAMQLDVRAAIIIERLDADGDRLISPREYQTWSQVSE